MVKAIRIHATGGPDALRLDEIDLPAPRGGEVRVRQHWAGVNFVDIYQRTGLYPVPALPACLGVEAAGVIEAVGSGVTGLAVGQRVAWAGAPPGGYAQAHVIAAERLVALPDGVSEQTAAAAMLRGLTAHMLLYRVWPVGRGDVLLVHAAAGGLGQILVRWAKRLGAEVIGVAGGSAKVEAARAAGADHVVDRQSQDFVAEVARITGGRGVDVVYDGVGGETLLRSLDCVRPFGMVVSLGQASGALPDIALSELGPRRSLSLARPSIFRYLADLAGYRAAAADLFAVLQDGLPVESGTIFPLEEAAAAHRALEAGETSGSLLLDLR